MPRYRALRRQAALRSIMPLCSRIDFHIGLQLGDVVKEADGDLTATPSVSQHHRRLFRNGFYHARL